MGAVAAAVSKTNAAPDARAVATARQPDATAITKTDAQAQRDADTAAEREAVAAADFAADSSADARPNAGPGRFFGDARGHHRHRV